LLAPKLESQTMPDAFHLTRDLFRRESHSEVVCRSFPYQQL
jgi:hypothetical protein